MNPKQSQNKRELLREATIKLVNNDGFHAAPMSKIAKEAQVSPGTIYLYFENKQDLINQVYIDVKAAYTQYAFKDYNQQTSIEACFKTIWYNIAAFKLKNLDYGIFLSQCDNTPIIDEEARREGLKHLQPLLDLWELGKEKKVIKDIDPYVLYAFTLYPINFLIISKKRGALKLNQTHIDHAYTSAWQSIKV